MELDTKINLLKQHMALHSICSHNILKFFLQEIICYTLFQNVWLVLSEYLYGFNGKNVWKSQHKMQNKISIFVCCFRWIEQFKCFTKHNIAFLILFLIHFLIEKRLWEIKLFCQRYPHTKKKRSESFLIFFALDTMLKTRVKVNVFLWLIRPKRKDLWNWIPTVFLSISSTGYFEKSPSIKQSIRWPAIWVEILLQQIKAIHHSSSFDDEL